MLRSIETAGIRLTCLLLVGCAVAVAQEVSVESLRATLEANCVTCYGASKDKYVAAARALETYVESHGEDTTAKRLLAKTYGEWAFGYEERSNPAEFERLIEHRQLLYRELVATNPNDADLLLEYSSTIDDPKQMLAVLEKASALAPDNTRILMTIGQVYTNLNDRDTGLQYMERAFALEKTGLKLEYGRSLIAALKDAGKTTEVSRVTRELETFEDAASKSQQ
jgi:tetratricopeptide (TPR) repeat protein